MTRYRSWLRHCATSRKVVGLIPDGVIEIFHLHNPSNHTMALGSTQTLTEMNTSNISGAGKGCRCVGLTTLPLSCVDCLEIGGDSTSWKLNGLYRDCFIVSFTYCYGAAVIVLVLGRRLV
jgi:hypothetical protein